MRSVSGTLQEHGTCWNGKPTPQNRWPRTGALLSRGLGTQAANSKESYPVPCPVYPTRDNRRATTVTKRTCGHTHPWRTSRTGAAPSSQKVSVPKPCVDVFRTPNACLCWNDDLMGDRNIHDETSITLQRLFILVSSQNKIIICPVRLAPVECPNLNHSSVILGKSVELSASVSPSVNQG